MITDNVSWSWLHRRCVLWGLATGAGAGCLVAIAIWGDAYGVLVLFAGDAGALPVLCWGWNSTSKAYTRAG